MLILDSWPAVSADEVGAYAARQEKSLFSLYAVHDTPYGGELSRSTGCPAELHPERRTRSDSGFSGWAFAMPASERHGYGVCIRDQAQYHSIYVILYCGKIKKAFDLKYFVPKHQPKPDLGDFLNGFSCGP